MLLSFRRETNDGGNAVTPASDYTGNNGLGDNSIVCGSNSSVVPIRLHLFLGSSPLMTLPVLLDPNMTARLLNSRLRNLLHNDPVFHLPDIFRQQYESEFNDEENSMRIFFSGRELLVEDDGVLLSTFGITRECSMNVFLKTPVPMKDLHRAASHIPYELEFSSIAPQILLTTGGARVIIRGSGFTSPFNLAYVRLDDSTIVSGIIHSYHEISFIAPAHIPGIVNVEISMNGRDFTQSGQRVRYVTERQRNEAILIGTPCNIMSFHEEMIWNIRMNRRHEDDDHRRFF